MGGVDLESKDFVLAAFGLLLSLVFTRSIFGNALKYVLVFSEGVFWFGFSYLPPGNEDISERDDLPPETSLTLM